MDKLAPQGFDRFIIYFPQWTFSHESKKRDEPAVDFDHYGCVFLVR